jgi:hypothetical protein
LVQHVKRVSQGHITLKSSKDPIRIKSKLKRSTQEKQDKSVHKNRYNKIDTKSQLRKFNKPCPPRTLHRTKNMKPIKKVTQF